MPQAAVGAIRKGTIASPEGRPASEAKDGRHMAALCGARHASCASWKPAWANRPNGSRLPGRTSGRSPEQSRAGLHGRRTAVVRVRRRECGSCCRRRAAARGREHGRGPGRSRAGARHGVGHGRPCPGDRRAAQAPGARNVRRRRDRLTWTVPSGRPGQSVRVSVIRGRQAFRWRGPAAVCSGPQRRKITVPMRGGPRPSRLTGSRQAVACTLDRHVALANGPACPGWTYGGTGRPCSGWTGAGSVTAGVSNAAMS